MRPEKLVVNRILQGFIILCMIIILPIFLIEMWSMIKYRGTISLRSPTTRWRIPLAATSFFSLILLGIDGSYEWVNWTSNPDGCYVSSGFITLFFVLMKQSLYLFLYDRAKIVHEALQIQRWELRALRWIIWVVVVAGVHICFGWSYFLNFYGRVSVDGDCIYYTRWPEVIIAFAVSDAMLNIGMLLLFAVPLYLETQQASGLKTKATQKIRSLMKRNMIVSLTITSLDITSLSLMTYFFMHTDPGNDSLEYRILWGNTAAVADQLAVVVGSHTMTAGWISPSIRQRIKSIFRRNQVETDTLTTGHNPA